MCLTILLLSNTRIFHFSLCLAGALIHDALSKLHNTSKRKEIAEQIRDLLTGEGSPEKQHLISQYLELLETDPESEQRYENEDWFEGMHLVDNR